MTPSRASGNQGPSAKLRTGRISLVGDVLLHSNLIRFASTSNDFTFARQFEEISSEITRSDCASANLESIAAGQKYGISGFPKFNAPPTLLDGLKASGFNVLNVANNHMLDKGEEALLESVSNIQERQLQPTGAGATESELNDGAVVETNGIKLGFVSFTDGSKISPNSLKNAHINYFDGEYTQSRMIRRITQIKKKINYIKGKCDVVVLQLHFGEEYHRHPSAFQRELVTSLCELPVDVIVGHHPHVLQPVEWIENSKGKKVLVAFSLGNYFSGQAGLYRQIGGIFTFSITQFEKQGKTVNQIIDPKLKLTYVDHQDSFTIKSFSSFTLQRPTIQLRSGEDVDTENVYSTLTRKLAGPGGPILVD